jgi:hypothetical protein
MAGQYCGLFYSHTSILFFFQEKPVFTFANEMGINMLETSFVALQDLSLDKIFDDAGRKALYSEIPKLMEQVFNCFFQELSKFFSIKSSKIHFTYVLLLHSCAV